MFEIVNKELYVQEILWSERPENASGWPEGVCGLQAYFVWTVGLFLKNVFSFLIQHLKMRRRLQDFQLLLKNRKIWQHWTTATSPGV